MKKLIRRSVLALVLGILAIGIFGWMQPLGTIPGFADTRDVSYAKSCGFEPSHGRVWTASSGWGGGWVFYRLHYARESYAGSQAVVLTESNRPPLDHAPWWWGMDPNGRATVLSGGGLGFNTRSYQIYDPDEERLYVYCEWD